MIERLHFVTPGEDREVEGAWQLCREFPTIEVKWSAQIPTGAVLLEAAQWDELVEEGFEPFEHAMERAAEQRTVAIAGPRSDVARVGWEVLTRWQRLVGRRNRASSTILFDRVLRTFLELHAGDKPLVVADRNHALDTWQWVLRLQPGAGFEVQVAALYHDVERLSSEADVRVEHLAPDYQAFKDEHAQGSASLARARLAEVGVEAAQVERICELLRGHEHRTDEGDGSVLSDADGLSFFSHNANGYLSYFGPEQTRRKIRYTIARIAPGRRMLLDRMRMHRDVRAILVGELLGRPAAGPFAMEAR